MGKRKYDAVAIHDGTAWRLIVIGGKSASGVKPNTGSSSLFT